MDIRRTCFTVVFFHSSSMTSGGTMHITNISCTGVEDNVFGCQYGNTSMSQCGNTYLFITCSEWKQWEYVDVFN